MANINSFTILGDLNCYRTSNAGKRYGKQKLYTEEQLEEVGLNKFLLIHFIHAHPILLNMSDYLNHNYKTLTLYQMYLFVFFVFKEINIGDIKWVKQEKVIKPEDILMLQKYYLCSYKIAFDYLNELDEKDFDYIRDYYRMGGKKNTNIGNKV